jgi:hypothetical protein
MNSQFHKIISANRSERQDLFLRTANRLGTAIENIEKDFWVSWILDLLFNGRCHDEPRLLFKGGTSLSKAYSLISRFSEDVDITVFREDIGQNIEIKDLKELSGKKQRVQLDAIRNACQTYINGHLKNRLNQQVESIFKELKVPFSKALVQEDPNDPDKQTLLFCYPTMTDNDDRYIRPLVKIEAGAKSALDPHCFTTIKPYIEQEMSNIDLSVSNIVTIDAERTFWDKVVILHGIRRWYDNRGVLRQQGHRISRHYYDVYKLFKSPIYQTAINDHALALDCARHAQLFFNSNDLDLMNAVPGTLSLVPIKEMLEILKNDYNSMSGMIFGEIPDLSEILHSISDLENILNQNISNFS